MAPGSPGIWWQMPTRLYKGIQDYERYAPHLTAYHSRSSPAQPEIAFEPGNAAAHVAGIPGEAARDPHPAGRVRRRKRAPGRAFPWLPGLPRRRVGLCLSDPPVQPGMRILLQPAGDRT